MLSPLCAHAALISFLFASVTAKATISPLQFLELRGNSLSGHIPSSLGNLTLLFYLDASFNALRGTIPATLGRLQHLTVLSLSNNFLDGAIPKEVADLPFLSQGIDWSSNLLTGPIPLPACPMQQLESKRPKLVPLLIAGSSLCFVLLLIIIFVLIYRRQSKKLQSTPLSSRLDIQYSMISYAESSISTAGFDAANLIGRGSCGTVYKATLGHENRTIGVKVFDLQQLGSSQSFSAECEALSRIRHRNLIII